MREEDRSVEEKTNGDKEGGKRREEEMSGEGRRGEIGGGWGIKEEVC